jgi:hypothetical protein
MDKRRRDMESNPEWWWYQNFNKKLYCFLNYNNYKSKKQEMFI